MIGVLGYMCNLDAEKFHFSKSIQASWVVSNMDSLVDLSGLSNRVFINFDDLMGIVCKTLCHVSSAKLTKMGLLSLHPSGDGCTVAAS